MVSFGCRICRLGVANAPLVRLCAFVSAAVCLRTAILARADTFTITSTPRGATVEINNVREGVTPFTKNYPGGDFHRTLTSIGRRLTNPMVARLTSPVTRQRKSYSPQGPQSGFGINGRSHGEYYLFKGDHFEVITKVGNEPYRNRIIPVPDTETSVLADLKPWPPTPR